jgi:hypothetical protein
LNHLLENVPNFAELDTSAAFEQTANSSKTFGSAAAWHDFWFSMAPI